MSDPGNYRSKEEVNKYKENFDPVTNLKKYILTNDIASDAEFKSIETKVKDEVLEAFEFAKESPLPLASELLTDVLR